MSEITERLVRSLRLRAEYRQPGVMAIDDTDVVSKEAADIIEAQEARIAELEKALKEARHLFWGSADPSVTEMEEWVDRVDGIFHRAALSKPQTQ